MRDFRIDELIVDSRSVAFYSLQARHPDGLQCFWGGAVVCGSRDVSKRGPADLAVKTGEYARRPTVSRAHLSGRCKLLIYRGLTGFRKYSAQASAQIISHRL